MTHQLLTYSGRAPPLPSPTSPLSPIDGKKSKFIQTISENSRKVLIDKKFLDCEHDVPLTQHLKWQMSLEEALVSSSCIGSLNRDLGLTGLFRR